MFDIFLSHNNRDKSVVEAIARKLRDAGLKPWLDKWCLVPGGDWQNELAQGLRDCPACAVCVGPVGLGNWENLEFKVALDRLAADRAFRLFYVLLPGLPDPFDASQLPPFLSAARTWVDLRRGIDDSRAFQSLINAVKGVAPGPDAPIAPRNEVCPYRGLLPFGETEAEFFFGREGDIQRLFEKFKGTRFLAVVGPSGSGKSSLVRAGLVPRLKGGVQASSQDWKFAVLTPGTHPLSTLAVHLSRLDSQTPLPQLLEEMSGDARAFHLHVLRAMTDRPALERAVWVIDQFEEVFTLCRDENERQRFLDSLLFAASIPDGRSIVVVTMRADFYPRCAAHADLATQIAAHQFLVSPMDEPALREAIVEPARRVGVELESGLVETILADVARQPGALPLLEHALLELWQRRRGVLLTLEAYRDTGGVTGAIAARAEAVFTDFTHEQQELVKRILLRLTQPGEGTEDTRRRTTLAELITNPGENEMVEMVVRALTDSRLLTASADEHSGERLVEVAHEALIRGWPRLRKWIDEDRAALRVHRRLTEAAHEWQRLGREGSLLYRGARLAQAIEWREHHGAAMNAIEREFLDAGVALQIAERRAAERRTQLAVGGLVLVVVVVSIAAFVSWRERNKAVDLNRMAVSRELAAGALTQLTMDPELSVLLAVKAAETFPTEQAEDALRQSVPLLASHQVAVLKGHTDAVLSACFSLDGKYIATASEDQTTRVWATDTGNQVCQLRSHTTAVDNVSFSPDGRWVVSSGGSSDDNPIVWAMPSGKEVARLRGADVARKATFSRDGEYVSSLGNKEAGLWETKTWSKRFALTGHTGWINASAWSHNGRYIATGSRDKTARVWNAVTGTLVAELRGHTSEVKGVEFSPDDDFVLTVSRDNTVRAWHRDTGTNVFVLRNSSAAQSAVVSSAFELVLAIDPAAELWEIRSRAKRFELRGHTAPVIGAAFSPAGDLIATAGEDKTARIWEADTGRGVTVLHGHTDALTGVSFHPDGTLILTSSRDHTARLWHVGREKLISELPSPSGWIGGGMLWSEFSPDGQRVISGEQEGREGAIWEARTGEIIAPLRGHEDGVKCVAFSPNGKLAATGSKDRTARIWDATTGQCLAILQGHTSVVTRVRFSPDSKLLLTASEDQTARLWDSGTGQLVRQLIGHTTPLRDAAFSPSGRHVATASSDGTIVRVWSTGTGQTIAELGNHEAGVSSVHFSPDGRRIVTAGWDSVGRIWDTERGRLIVELRGHVQHVGGMFGGMDFADFSPNGQEVVTAGRDHAAHIWDAATGKSLLELRGHTADVNDAAFNPNGKLVATASNDGTVRVWDTSTGECLATISAFVGAGAMTVRFSPDGRWLLVTGFNSTARIYSCEVCASLTDLLALARNRVTRQLTPVERHKYLH